MIRNYDILNKSGVHFVTFVIVYWFDIFTRQLYNNILVDIVNYCLREKGMGLYCNCFKPSHVHL